MKKSFSLKNAHHSSSSRIALVCSVLRISFAVAVRLLQLDDAAEEVHAEQGRLAAVPDELDHRGRLRLDVLLDVAARALRPAS